MSGKHDNEKKSLSYRTAIWVEQILDIMEILLAITVMIAFVCTFISLIQEIPGLVKESAGGHAFHEFLEFALMLVVGIEFVKMLIKHTPGSVLEVLLFAIARHLVLNHDNGLENVLCILAIAGIFAIRKFLSCESFETPEEGQKLDWLISPGMHSKSDGETQKDDNMNE